MQGFVFNICILVCLCYSHVCENDHITVVEIMTLFDTMVIP